MNTMRSSSPSARTQASSCPSPATTCPGCCRAREFLRETGLANSVIPDGRQMTIKRSPFLIQGKRVLVLGGGNVAIDTAMTAMRLGAAWVGMTCLEGREQMPAHDWEVREAEEEGIQVYPARTFKEITSQDGQVTGVRTARSISAALSKGDRISMNFPDTEEVIPADVVIFAIGQRVEFELPEAGGTPAGWARGDRQDQPGHQRAGNLCRRRRGHRHSLHRDRHRGRSSQQRGRFPLTWDTTVPQLEDTTSKPHGQAEPGGG